jgi:hypothetical protein
VRTFFELAALGGVMPVAGRRYEARRGARSVAPAGFARRDDETR